MRVIILQPPYPHEGTEDATLRCMEWMLQHLDALRPGGQDLILLPEYANAPGLEEESVLRAFVQTHGAKFADRLAAKSRELGSLLAAGLISPSTGLWENRAFLFGPKGETVASYAKVHLTTVERERMGITPGASVVVAEHAGTRIGFATCLDIYLPEFTEALAARGVDLILHSSYQRSEEPERIRLLCRARALDAGAYVLRSGYAMGRADRGGSSLVAAPDGTLLADAGSEPGLVTSAIQPKEKFAPPASHGQPPVEHRKRTEPIRRPGLYRPAADRAAALLATPLPWVCAHRGLSAVCPENTLPAFGAAIAAGAQEVEMDLWMTRDGVPVICHDPRLDRTTDGQGVIQEMTWEEIRQLDAGVRFGERWRGLRIPRFEEVLDVVDGRAGLNLHVKDPGPQGALVRMMRAELRKRGLVELAYLGGNEKTLRAAREIAPEIPRACLDRQSEPDRQIDLAVEYGCRRIQFYRHATEEHFRRARDLGIICNLYWSDEPADARAYVERGVDVILTNAAHQVTRAALIA